MDHRKDSGSKGSTLSFLHLSSLEFADLVGITQSTLDHGDVHKLLNLLCSFACAFAFTPLQLVISHSKEVEKLVVDLSSSIQVGSLFSTRLEVAASLVTELVQQFTIIREAILSFNRTSVEAHSLVPSMNRTFVAVDALRFTIIQRVLKFTNDIHENIHVGCSLLDSLFPTVHAELGEVSITPGELSLPSFEGSLNPLVCVVIHAVVIVEGFVVIVGAALGAVKHEFLGTSGEFGDSATIVVLRGRIILVCLSLAINGDGASRCETSLHIGLHQ
mmetsp:Transcript_18886/g.32489  ORF Transcript_18886/g.32489 Transcript_18886/m.32489 type:complete len:274 (-) Transcript_18886:534-1355(-)